MSEGFIEKVSQFVKYVTYSLPYELMTLCLFAVQGGGSEGQDSVQWAPKSIPVDR